MDFRPLLRRARAGIAHPQSRRRSLPSSRPNSGLNAAAVFSGGFEKRRHFGHRDDIAGDGCGNKARNIKRDWILLRSVQSLSPACPNSKRIADAFLAEGLILRKKVDTSSVKPWAPKSS
jgi:hypothetical protein